MTAAAIQSRWPILRCDFKLRQITTHPGQNPMSDSDQPILKALHSWTETAAQFRLVVYLSWHHWHIWNLATPDIEGCFDIEAFDMEGCFDIEYTTFDIEVFASISKLTKNLWYRRNFGIEGWTFDMILGSNIEDILYRSWFHRYRWKMYSISKFKFCILGTTLKIPDIRDPNLRYWSTVNG
jgi:hypothetical protein